MITRAWALPIVLDSVGPWGDDLRHPVVLAVALLALCFPSLASALVLAVTYLAVRCVEPFAIWPVHVYITASVAASVVLGALVSALHRRARPDAGDMLVLLKWPLRVTAAAVFFAGFAKLNHDFLDARISCGGVYYLWTREWPGLDFLPRSHAAKRFVIGMTVALELGGPLLLLARRTRHLGVVLIWMLAIGISSNTRHTYFEFIGVFWVCSLFWLEPGLLHGAAGAMAAANARAWGWLRAPIQEASLLTGGIRLMLGVNVFAALQVGEGLNERPPHVYFWLASGLLAIGGVALAVFYAWLQRGRGVPAPVPRAGGIGPLRFAMLLIPAFVLFNEGVTYLGLPHGTALRMASNFNAGPAATNHLVLPHIPALPFAVDVEIERSNVPGLRRGHHLSLLLLRHLLTEHPDARLSYRVAGGPTQHLASDRAVSELASRSWLVDLFGLRPYRPHTERLLCAKREPGKSKKRTLRAMQKRLARGE